jgi:hypothetical protein
MFAGIADHLWSLRELQAATWLHNAGIQPEIDDREPAEVVYINMAKRGYKLHAS